VARDWVRTALEIMSSVPRLGAVSGISTPACEVPSPAWFSQYHSPYAILTEQDLGEMPSPPAYLPTAGLCVRKEAWLELVRRGFRSLVPGRVGQDLSGGEDTELTLVLRSHGWNLNVDGRLQLQHFMPKHRLQWTYLRRLMRNCDRSTVLLDAYTDHSLSLKPGVRRRMSDSWWYQLGKTLGKLGRNPGAVFAAISSNAEGRYDVIEVERQFGRALGLVRSRSRYGESRRMVREASWRRLGYSNTRLKGKPESAVSTV